MPWGADSFNGWMNCRGPRPVLCFLSNLLALLGTISGVHGASGLTEFPRWDSSKLEGTGDAPLPFVTVEAFPDLEMDAPIYLAVVPGAGDNVRFLLAELAGKLWTFVNAPDAAERVLFLGLGGGEATGSRAPNKLPIRIIAVAFHRDYPRDPTVFVSYNSRFDNGERINRLSRFQVSVGDPPRADRETEEVLLEWGGRGHAGGDLKFGPDGFLYLSTGDGESPGDPGNVGQTVDNVLGSILRIDVDRAGKATPYRIPDDNPFVGMPGVRPEVWAYGLRNPWRMTFRPDHEEIWLGDNGDEHWEMVRRLRRGDNGGWSAFEGSHPFRTRTGLGGPVRGLTPPAVEHPHTEMRSVIGGFFYRGEKFPELRGHYLYGCYVTKKVWSVPVDGDTPGEPRRLADAGLQVVSFAGDGEGEVYVLPLDGPVLRLARPSEQQVYRPVPRLLSETGLFASTAAHRIESGVIPYDLNAPAWWDGMERERFFAMPADASIQVQKKPPGMPDFDIEAAGTRAAGLDRWRFLGGSAFMQTYYLPDAKARGGKRRVETQVSFNEAEEWHFYTYRWRENQEDAVLVPEAGETRKIGDREWRFMSRAECGACHTHRSFFVLGMNMGQLNRDFDYHAIGGSKGNQLETFSSLGFFKGKKLPKVRGEWPRSVAPCDESASLDERVRTYLHVNCAHCHRETGLGGRAEFQLLRWLTLEETGAVGARPVVGLPGVEDARIIAPGQPERSEIWRRMATRGPGKMPLIGSDRVDEKGLELVTEWIRQMGKSK